ncbi:hypothetical protein HY642_04020 [Candidatus Woesearchaeota archaeon]|nr:hypothetical protein [Candidatus Woesearchaeota archaeon]
MPEEVETVRLQGAVSVRGTLEHRVNVDPEMLEARANKAAWALAYIEIIDSLHPGTETADIEREIQYSEALCDFILDASGEHAKKIEDKGFPAIILSHLNTRYPDMFVSLHRMGAIQEKDGTYHLPYLLLGSRLNNWGDYKDKDGTVYGIEPGAFRKALADILRTEIYKEGMSRDAILRSLDSSLKQAKTEAELQAEYDLKLADLRAQNQQLKSDNEKLEARNEDLRRGWGKSAGTLCDKVCELGATYTLGLDEKPYLDELPEERELEAADKYVMDGILVIASSIENYSSKAAELKGALTNASCVTDELYDDFIKLADIVTEMAARHHVVIDEQQPAVCRTNGKLEDHVPVLSERMKQVMGYVRKGVDRVQAYLNDTEAYADSITVFVKDLAVKVIEPDSDSDSATGIVKENKVTGRIEEYE